MRQSLRFDIGHTAFSRRIILGPLVCGLCLAIAGCAPVPVEKAASPFVPSATPGLAYQNVAAEQAAQAALSTRDAVNRLSAQATADAASTAYAHAFSVTQTADALSLQTTQTAATATTVAIQIEQTKAVNHATDEAAQTQAAATEVAAVREIRLRRAEYEAQVAQERAEAWRQISDFGRWAMAASIVAVGMLAAVVFWRWMDTKIEYQRLQVAREAIRELSGGRWAEWTSDGGWQVYALPASSMVVEGKVEHRAPDPGRLERWRMMTRRFVMLGHSMGFAIRTLGPAGARVVSDEGWRTYTDILAEAGVLTKVGATRWAEGWDYQRFRHEIAGGFLSLPYPESEPPEVAMPQHIDLSAQ